MTTRPKKTSGDARSPIYAVFGSDDFLRGERLRELLDRLLGEDRYAMAVAEFSGEAATLADVLDECRTLSLLAPIRVVCVRDADDFVSEHRKHLEAYLQAPSPSGVLVLVCRTWSKSTRLYKQVAALGGNIECEPLKRGEFRGWVIGRARHHGCTLSAAAAERLLELAGEELGILDSELSKLATYITPRKDIGPADVEAVVGASRAEKVFGVVNAIAARDAGRALELWDQVLATDRKAPQLAVGGLGWGFRRLASAKRTLSQGASLSEVRNLYKIWERPQDFARQLDRFSLERWEDHLLTLLRIDVGAKTGLGDVESSVGKFIVELCAAS